LNPETITDLGYITELHYPPQIFNKGLLRGFYTELGEALDLTESKELTDGIQFVSHFSESKEITRYLIRKANIAIVNDFTSENLEMFWRRAEMFIKRAVEVLRIPIFIPQIYVVRILANPQPTNDSRVFIGNMVCRFRPENLSFFQRPAQTVGLRFYFPPESDTPYEFDVKIESRMTDVTKIFLENKARFLRPIPRDNLSIVRDNLNTTRKFLTENLTQFLCQYNKQREDL